MEPEAVSRVFGSLLANRGAQRPPAPLCISRGHAAAGALL